MDEMKRPEGISRRELMKKGAIAGGTVLWAAPLIQSLGSAAHAHNVPGSPRHGCCQCTGCPQPPGNAQGNFCLENGCLDDCAATCESFGCTGTSTNHCGPNIIDCVGGLCGAH